MRFNWPDPSGWWFIRRRHALLRLLRMRRKPAEEAGRRIARQSGELAVRQGKAAALQTVEEIDELRQVLPARAKAAKQRRLPPLAVQQRWSSRVEALVIDPRRPHDIATTFVPTEQPPASALTLKDNRPFAVVCYAPTGRPKDWPTADGHYQAVKNGSKGWEDTGDGWCYVPREHVYSPDRDDGMEIVPRREYLEGLLGLEDAKKLTDKTPREFGADLTLDDFAELLRLADVLNRANNARLIGLVMCGALILAIIFAVVVYTGSPAQSALADATTPTPTATPVYPWTEGQ